MKIEFIGDWYMLEFYDSAGRPVPDKDFYNLKRFLAEGGTLLGWINFDDFKPQNSDVSIQWQILELTYEAKKYISSDVSDQTVIERD